MPKKKEPSLWGFTIRLVIFIFLILAPIYALVLYHIFETRRLAFVERYATALQFVRLVTFTHERLVAGTNQLLVSLSELPEIQDQETEACDAFLLQLQQQQQIYLELGAADAQGNIFCLAPRTASEPRNISQTPHFMRAQSTGAFAQGGFSANKELEKPSVSFAYPVFDRQDVEGIVFATVDVSLLEGIFLQVPFPIQSEFFIVGTDGAAFAHIPPPPVGVAGTPGTKILGAQKDEGLIEEDGLDGIGRFYAYTRLDKTAEDSPYVAVGFSRDVLFAETNRNFWLSIFVITLILLITLMVASITGRNLILRRIKALQEVDRLKGEMVSLASHQLRSPLTSLSWFIEILLSGKVGRVEGEQKSILEQVYESITYLKNMVKELLSISRIEAGRLSVNPEPTDLVELARSIVRELEPQFKEKNFRFEFFVKDELPKINLDPLVIRQVIGNLLTNAIKYTPAGEKIRLSIQKEGAFVRINVSDTGMGIPIKEQEKIFGRFFRAENVRDKVPGGTGLGLYLVKLLVELSGGAIGFVSEEGKGTTFSFTLPLSGVQKKEGEVRLGA